MNMKTKKVCKCLDCSIPFFDTALSLYLSFYPLQNLSSSVFQDMAVDQISKSLTFEFQCWKLYFVPILNFIFFIFVFSKYLKRTLKKPQNIWRGSQIYEDVIILKSWQNFKKQRLPSHPSFDMTIFYLNNDFNHCNCYRNKVREIVLIKRCCLNFVLMNKVLLQRIIIEFCMLLIKNIDCSKAIKFT